MKVAVGSDEKTRLTDFVVDYLKKKGAEVRLFGPLSGEEAEWADVAEAVALEVAGGGCGQGVVFCWTGTGVSIAANKIPGVRAALCCDSETAAGARKWNDANVLAMSLRLTSNGVAREILDAWFAAAPEESEKGNMEKVSRLERKHGTQK